ncbi:Flp pilus assembly complex ATPase component TadA [Candidatus Woesearchaeota archaeon]|nr:Flp pilus assembly complex ATPase component TadA [Candidatus Woesearchaeota archaeon]
MDPKFEKITPDTSVLIDGILSKLIRTKKISPVEVIFHEAVLAELEHQANENRTTGILGLEELKKVRELGLELGFEVKFTGSRPTLYQIKDAKLGEIDAMIRDLAWETNSCLVTSDKIQAKVAESKGILCEYVPKTQKITKLKLDQFFDEQTMSVHLRELVLPYAKKGRPGAWTFEAVRETKLTNKEIKEISDEIIEEAERRQDSFLEIERKGSLIIQLGNYRIVITKPPFSDGWEITAVRPVKKLSLEDYEVPQKIMERIETQAEGILIAGAPGQGKSTFAQALAEFYANLGKIVKTVEAPRDLVLPEEITQYAISHGSPEEIHDILLLCRPDYTIFDEMRNTQDFSLFADMRLAGVGLVGVVHATNAIDAIQRFIGRLELGVIPQVIDTVLFIKDGGIGKVFEIEMKVKVPSGMTEADLARPIVCVFDFLTGKLEYEIYSYGESTVVVPVTEEDLDSGDSPVQALAKQEIEKAVQKYAKSVVVEMKSDRKCTIKVPESDMATVIGKQGKTVIALEEKLGMKIDVQALAADEVDEQRDLGQEITFDMEVSKKTIQLFLDSMYQNELVDVYVEGEFLLEVKVSKKAIIKIKKDNNIGKVLLRHIKNGDEIKLYV